VPEAQVSLANKMQKRGLTDLPDYKQALDEGLRHPDVSDVPRGPGAATWNCTYSWRVRCLRSCAMEIMNQ
jgi:hypothetical protein